MKKYLPIILLLIASLMLPSCVGIGDGAMFDNITTSEPSAQGAERTVCTLELYTSNKQEKLDEALIQGAEAEDLLEYLSSATEPYIEGIDDDLMGYNYVIASFERYDKNGNKLPDHDGSTGALQRYFVRDNDNIDQGNMMLSYGWSSLGRLKGAYEKLFGYIAEKGSSQGIFCHIGTENAPMATFRISGAKARARYILLSEGNYRTDMDRTALEHTYVILSFYGAVDATYYVYSDDYVEEFNSYPYTNASMFIALGFLDGIYEYCLELFEEALDYTTDEEYEAGVKLNCLEVQIEPETSRVFYLSDFEDIGCVYLKSVSQDPHSYMLYFHDCNKADLEEKLENLKVRTYVKDASLIYIKVHE